MTQIKIKIKMIEYKIIILSLSLFRSLPPPSHAGACLFLSIALYLSLSLSASLSLPPSFSRIGASLTPSLYFSSPPLSTSPSIPRGAARAAPRICAKLRRLHPSQGRAGPRCSTGRRGMGTARSDAGARGRTAGALRWPMGRARPLHRPCKGRWAVAVQGRPRSPRGRHARGGRAGKGARQELKRSAVF